MKKSTFSSSCALALAIATPSVASPPGAFSAVGDEAAATRPPYLQLAQEMRADGMSARSVMSAELAKMTTAQKRELGESKIRKAQSLTDRQIAAKGCFTHGVGCKGIPAFSKGVLCCLIIKAGL